MPDEKLAAERPQVLLSSSAAGGKLYSERSNTLAQAVPDRDRRHHLVIVDYYPGSIEALASHFLEPGLSG